MTVAWILHFLNLMGTLSVNHCATGMKLSRLHLILNSIKICGFVLSKNRVFEFFIECLKPSLNEHSFTPFSKILLQIHSYSALVLGIMMLLLQLVTSRKNIHLINQMLNFQNELLGKIEFSKKIFEDYVMICRKHFVIIFSVASIWLFSDFMISMQFNFKSLLAHFLYWSPYFINISVTFYVFTIIQFFIHSQKALILHVEQVDLTFSETDLKIKLIIEEITELHATLYHIKENFMTLLGVQILMIIFHNITEAMFQVSITKASKCSFH